MNITPYLIAAAIGYLLGSIPFGYLLVRILKGQDIRATGSGNIGATNVSRTSPRLGAATLLLDAANGLAAGFLVRGVCLRPDPTHHTTPAPRFSAVRLLHD